MQPGHELPGVYGAISGKVTVLCVACANRVGCVVRCESDSGAGSAGTVRQLHRAFDRRGYGRKYATGFHAPHLDPVQVRPVGRQPTSCVHRVAFGNARVGTWTSLQADVHVMIQTRFLLLSMNA